MTRFDLVVRGGTIVQPGVRPFEADISVTDGRIAALLGSGTQVDAAEWRPRASTTAAFVPEAVAASRELLLRVGHQTATHS